MKVHLHIDSADRPIGWADAQEPLAYLIVARKADQQQEATLG